MSKRRYIVIIVMFIVCYNLLAWQHLATNFQASSEFHLRIYYSCSLALFLGAVFFTYLLEKKHNAATLATLLYIILFLTGVPFLYNLVLFIILISIPGAL